MQKGQDQKNLNNQKNKGQREQKENRRHRQQPNGQKMNRRDRKKHELDMLNKKDIQGIESNLQDLIIEHSELEKPYEGSKRYQRNDRQGRRGQGRRRGSKKLTHHQQQRQIQMYQDLKGLVDKDSSNQDLQAQNGSFQNSNYKKRRERRSVEARRQDQNQDRKKLKQIYEKQQLLDNSLQAEERLQIDLEEKRWRKGQQRKPRQQKPRQERQRKPRQQRERKPRQQRERRPPRQQKRKPRQQIDHRLREQRQNNVKIVIDEKQREQAIRLELLKQQKDLQQKRQHQRRNQQKQQRNNKKYERVQDKKGYKNRQQPREYNRNEKNKYEKIKKQQNIPKERSSKQPPEYLLCPITQSIMESPVILITCGHTFDQKTIREWLSKQQKCPLCNKPSSQMSLVKNFALAEVINAMK